MERQGGGADPGEARAFLADFGLAKLAATGSKLTRTGEALGTPAYMSPEQARGEVSSLTPATNVWSLGCVLYEMLAGRPPFRGETSAAVIAAVLVSPPPRLAALAPGVPRDVETVVRAALVRDAGRRVPGAVRLRDELGRVLDGRRPTVRAPVSRGARLVAATAVLSLAPLAALAWPRAGPEAPGAPEPAGTPEAEALHRKARGLRQSDPAAAAALLSRALALEPGRHPVRVELGLLLWALGRGAEAREHWARVPEGSPESAPALFYRGLEALFRFEDGGFARDEARPDLERVARGSVREGRLARAALAALRQDWAATRLALEDEVGWEAALLRAHAEGADPAGDRSAELRGYDQALSEGIPFAWAHLNRALARASAGDDRGAIEDCGAALRLRPAFPEALHTRGVSRAMLGERQEALADFTAAVEMSDGYFLALHNRGRLRSELGDHRGGIEDLTAALRRRSDSPEPYLSRSVARYAVGDYRGSAEDSEAAIRLGAVTAEVHSNLGAARQGAGDWAGAIAAYSEFLRLAPDHAQAPNVRVWLADCESRLRSDPGR
ncbi:MAG: tetratricopeptide repeat protein [Planctomycetales bacterium]|nr:tetratricopeptide repeat protein [Planctomycetales bacterium]